MKTIDAALTTHIATRNTTLAHAMRITRLDDQVFAFTSHNEDSPISGVTYDASQGLDVKNILTTAGAAVDNTELTTLHDGSLFTEGDILNGVWDNAAFLIFQYNWASVSDGVVYLLAGNFGNVNMRQNSVVAELRGLQQYWQQSVGRYLSKTCTYRLGLNDGIFSRCTFNLVAATVTGTLNSVTSNQVFRDSTRGQAADYFGEGVFTFTSGLNNGVSRRIKTYAANGTFTLDRPMYLGVSGTETYSAKPGCRKRYDEDCIAKFDVAVDFGGFPHAPGRNAIITPASPSV